MITPSFSLTATERVLPKLALDFTTASLDARVTFTRSGSTATRVNASGFVESVAADTPRFDFNPVTLVCKGLLIEEARTNLLTYSEQMDAVGWKTSSATVSANQAVSPDNTTNADKIIPNNNIAVPNAQVYNQQSVSASTTYTLSVYAKAAEMTSFNLSFTIRNSSDVYLGQAYCTFNLSNGTASAITYLDTAPTNVSATISNAGNGWYRCSITATTTATTALLNSSLRNATVGNGSNGYYVWGAQLELGAFATSYIPTTTTALTRNADVATMTGTNFSDWFNASEGTFGSLVVPKAIDAVNGNTIISVNDTTNFNRYYAYVTTTAVPNLQIRASSTVYMQATNGTALANNSLPSCFAYKTNSCAFSVSANSSTTDNSVTLPTVTQMQLGAHGTSVYLNGWIQKINYWPQRVIDAQVRAISKG